MQVSPKSIELSPPLASRTQTVAVRVANDSGSGKHLAFKVKTTAPKLYCVRPNCGSLAPGQSTEVAITYQGADTEPAPSAKCKDKFLFVGIETEETMDHKQVAAQWPQLEAAAASPQQCKVRVAYKAVEEMSMIAEEQPQAAPVKESAVELEPVETNKDAAAAAVAPATAVATAPSPLNRLVLVAILVALFAAWRMLWAARLLSPAACASTRLSARWWCPAGTSCAPPVSTARLLPARASVLCVASPSGPSPSSGSRPRCVPSSEKYNPFL